MIRLLLRDQDREITGDRLVEMLCDLYNTFLAEMAEDPNENNISPMDKADVKDDIFNGIVRFALAQVWSGRNSASASQTLVVSLVNHSEDCCCDPL